MWLHRQTILAEAEIAKRGKRTNHVGSTFVVCPPNGAGTVTLIRRPSGWALCDYAAEFDSRAPIPQAFTPRRSSSAQRRRKGRHPRQASSISFSLLRPNPNREETLCLDHLAACSAQRPSPEQYCCSPAVRPAIAHRPPITSSPQSQQTDDGVSRQAAHPDSIRQYTETLNPGIEGTIFVPTEAGLREAA